MCIGRGCNCSCGEREGGREGEREGGREGGKEEGREGGRERRREGGRDKRVCLSEVPCLPHSTTHSTHHTHLTHVHNTPSPVVGGGGGAVVVSPITSATDRPRMKRGSMNIHNRDKGEVASTGPVSQQLLSMWNYVHGVQSEMMW